ncbi:MAG: S41 family peptidase [Candidatus Aminicenantaceae bacterium]
MTIKKEKLFLIGVLVLASLFFLFERGFLPGVTSKNSPYKSFELLGNVIGLIKRDYIEEVSPERTMMGALKGLIDSLDIVSSYLDKDNVVKFTKQKEAKLMDVGIVLSKRYGSFPVVIGVIEDSPAEKKGIRIGDAISALDDKSTMIMSLIETKLYLKDIEEKPLNIRLLRGTKTQEVVLERTLLFKKPYALSDANGGSKVLKIHHFFPPCVKMIKKEIMPVTRSLKKTLILDVRNCHEGDIEEASKFINLFLKANKIGYLEKHREAKQILSSSEDAILKKVPLAIWVNQATVGPGEVVAAVLQEMRQAMVVGVPTLGLAGKQELFPLADGSGLLLTTGVFHLNSGKKLWEKGVEPEVKIDLRDQSFESYLDKTLDILHCP